MTKTTVYIKYIRNNEFEWEIVNAHDKRPDFLNRSEYTPQPGDKLYIFPDCTIPRFKMKDFCERHNVAMVKKKESANILFSNVGPKTKNHGTFFECNSYCYFLNKEDMINFITKALEYRSGPLIILGESLINAIKDSESDYVVMDNGANWTLCSGSGYLGERLNSFTRYANDDGTLDPLDEDEIKESKGKVMEIRKDLYYSTSEQLNNINHVIKVGAYHQDALLCMINSDQTVIDEEMYQGLCSLFESSDRSNYKVAMEALSNSNYDASAVYIMMIFYKYHNQMYSCQEKYHVNFKSLQEYFGINVNRRIDFDIVCKILVDKKLVNSSNIHVLHNEAKEIITNNSGLKYFEVDSIKISESSMAELVVENKLVEEQI